MRQDAVPHGGKGAVPKHGAELSVPGATAKAGRQLQQRAALDPGDVESYWYRHNFKIKVGFSTLLLLEEVPVFLMSLFPYQKFVSFKTYI